MRCDNQPFAFSGEAGRLLRERKSAYARTMALEMGKPLKQGDTEAEKCALACEYFAEHAARMLAFEERQTEASQSYSHGRFPSATDVTCNLFGAFAGAGYARRKIGDVR